MPAAPPSRRRAALWAVWSVALPWHAGWHAGASAQVLTLGRDKEGQLTLTEQAGDTRPAREAPAPAARSSRLPPATSATAAPRTYRERPAGNEAARTAATPANAVVLFAANWCGYCRQARAYLQARGVAYTEVNVDTAEGRAAMAQHNAGNGIPLLVWGARQQRGFSVASYDALFAQRR